MGVPIDRGLTHYICFCESYFRLLVEMGVPIDRGLTHPLMSTMTFRIVATVEMGVPIDRGLTHAFLHIGRIHDAFL